MSKYIGCFSCQHSLSKNEDRLRKWIEFIKESYSVFPTFYNVGYIVGPLYITKSGQREMKLKTISRQRKWEWNKGRKISEGGLNRRKKWELNTEREKVGVE